VNFNVKATAATATIFRTQRRWIFTPAACDVARTAGGTRFCAVTGTRLGLNSRGPVEFSHRLRRRVERSWMNAISHCSPVAGG
jgi:hypothetical protein